MQRSLFKGKKTKILKCPNCGGPLKEILYNWEAHLGKHKGDKICSKCGYKNLRGMIK